MATRKESAADIVVTVGSDEVVVETLNVNKNIDIDTIYGSGKTLPDGYSINEVSYDGDLSCKGNRTDLEDTFFDANGIPKVLDAITISHHDGTTSNYYDILITSDGYEMSAGDTVETSFEFIAMSRDGDTEPTN
ncbi:hypothetical protein [Halonotius roseus]|uniref:Uncharacterized protein n=1 Tax=Halonotius roseus TaxID=2511997 RepID=A0A544QQY2_9EURY|nr:hypothetical protein [Halonotius roseus]TQQ81850.1 hypothetical protein EWF95_02630 [Halonotius roseus]